MSVMTAMEYLENLYGQLAEIVPAGEADLWTLTPSKKIVLAAKPRHVISNLIDQAKDELGRQRHLGRVAADAQWLEKVPEGRFALEYVNTTPGEAPTYLRFFNVRHGKEGTRHEGRVFLDETDGIRWGFYDRTPVRDKTERAAILANIAADVMAASQRYGYRFNVCGNCGRDLSDPLSVEIGIGPVCWESLNGWAKEFQAAMTLAAACS